MIVVDGLLSVSLVEDVNTQLSFNHVLQGQYSHNRCLINSEGWGQGFIAQDRSVHIVTKVTKVVGVFTIFANDTHVALTFYEGSGNFANCNLLVNIWWRLQRELTLLIQLRDGLTIALDQQK